MNMYIHVCNIHVYRKVIFIRFKLFDTYECITVYEYVYKCKCGICVHMYI